MLKTYLFSIAHNKAVDYIKHNSKVSVMTDDEFDKQLSDTRELECEIIINERAITVNKFLDNINSDYKAVLHMLYFEEVTYEETALILNKNKRQMKDLVYRAKQTLKVAMEKEGFTYEEL